MPIYAAGLVPHLVARGPVPELGRLRQSRGKEDQPIQWRLHRAHCERYGNLRRYKLHNAACSHRHRLWFGRNLYCRVDGPGPFPCPCNGGGGSLAQANIFIGGGSITSVTPLTPGSGYTAFCTVNLVGCLTGGTGGSVTPTTLGNGRLASITLTGGGSGYTSPPIVAISGGGGTGATATANLTPTSLGSVSVTAGGSGYDTNTTVSITGGGGTGATATVQIQGCP